MTRPLDQQVVVITGASSGIGKQTAKRFAEAGARVVIAARRGELLEDLAQELEDEGHTVLPVVTDVTDPAQLEALVQATLDRFEYIDTWVNNAGAAVFGPFDQIPAEDFAREIEVTLMSQISATRAVLPILRRQKNGTIINIASLFGRVPAPLYTPYVTAEFGLIGFSESLRQELTGTGVHLSLIIPAGVDTPFYDHARGAYGLKPRPLEPVYHPDTVARAIVHCAAHPRPEVVVGWATRSIQLAGRLFPRLSRRRMTHRAGDMLDTTTPIPFVDALYSPTIEGRDIRGGWGTTRERIGLSARDHKALIQLGVGALALGAGVLLARRLGTFSHRRRPARQWLEAQIATLAALGPWGAKRLLHGLTRLVGRRTLLDRAASATRHLLEGAEDALEQRERRPARGLSGAKNRALRQTGEALKETGHRAERAFRTARSWRKTDPAQSVAGEAKAPARDLALEYPIEEASADLPEAVS